MKIPIKVALAEHGSDAPGRVGLAVRAESERPSGWEDSIPLARDTQRHQLELPPPHPTGHTRSEPAPGIQPRAGSALRADPDRAPHLWETGPSCHLGQATVSD